MTGQPDLAFGPDRTIFANLRTRNFRPRTYIGIIADPGIENLGQKIDPGFAGYPGTMIHQRAEENSAVEQIQKKSR